MARHNADLLHAVALAPDLVGRPAHGHEAWLDVLGAVQVGGRPVEAEPAHRHLQDGLGAPEDAARRWITLVEPLTHSWSLHALAGEEERDRAPERHSHSSRQAAQVKPEPNPAISTLSPGCSRSWSSASRRASGMVAVDVFPKRSMLIMTRSFGRPTRCAAASMMRRFAWCGTQRSMSSIVRPAASATADACRMKMSVANLNTSGPFMLMNGLASPAAYAPRGMSPHVILS